MNMAPGSYSQYFNFFRTYKWAQYGRVLHSIRLDLFAKHKHSSLLDLFVSYGECLVLWTWPPGSYSHGVHIQRAWVRYKTSKTLVHDGFARFLHYGSYCCLCMFLNGFSRALVNCMQGVGVCCSLFISKLKMVHI